jgi:hypothetical protein
MNHVKQFVIGFGLGALAFALLVGVTLPIVTVLH